MGTEVEYGLFLPREGSERFYRGSSRWERSRGESSFWVSETARDIVLSASQELSSSFERDIPIEVLRDVEERALAEEERRKQERTRRRMLRPYFDDEWYDDDRWSDYDSRSILPTLQVKGRTGHVLANGARFYVDLGHPEYSTPECLSPRELIVWEKAGERIVALGREKVIEKTGKKIFVHKNNSDGKGNSYSCHENYLLNPETFIKVVSGGLKSRVLETFFVTRQIFTGAGKVGSESSRSGERIPFQISQRADFITMRLSTDTSYERAIINQRNRPYADRDRFRRLHVICGDSNMAELSILLKMGTTAIVLRMLEDGVFEKEKTFLSSSLRNPVHAFQEVSSDLDLCSHLSFYDGEKRTALEVQKEFLRLAERYFETLAAATPDNREVLLWWRFVLEHFSKSPEALDRYLDWRIKKKFLESRISKWDTTWKDERVRWIDIQYHNVNTEESWYRYLLEKGKIELFVDEADIKKACDIPPPSTRAWLRGMLIRNFLPELQDIGWDFVYAVDFLRDLPDPLKGSKQDSEERISRSRNAKEFFEMSEREGYSYT